MKKLFLVTVISMIGLALYAQPTFNLGLKGGLTSSDFSLSKENYSAENILSYHAGAFGRVGFGRIFIQPEVYFNSRGGEIFKDEINPVNVASKFDFSTVDVPLLAGIKLFKSDFVNVRAMGGPLFSFVTAKEVEGSRIGVDDFRNNFYGWQYGIGLDLWFVTLDARFENSRNSVIQTSDFNVRSNLFLLSAGIKIF
jgi:hypothetical protein